MQRSLLLKCLVLAFLALALLAPLALIERTVAERTRYRDEAVRAIASSSAGRQILTGPVISLPFEEDYDEELVSDKDNDRSIRLVHRKRAGAAILLPKKLDLNGALKVERRAYGIHSAAVYELHGLVSGVFDPPGEADTPPRGRNSVLTWGKPRVVVGIADVRGLVGEPKLRVGGAELVAAHSAHPLSSGFHAELAQAGLPTKTLPFEVELDLVGTESFSMVPVADMTTADLAGNWANPSFGGGFLPRERIVDKHGFQAHWAVSGLAAGIQRDTLGTSSGKAGDQLPGLSVRLIDPVDIYQLATRAVKYGALFVIAIFATFFAIEVIAALPIHPVQYTLVGLAQALFFLLLLSGSEHVAFGWAYLAAATACVALIVGYLAAVLRGVGRALGVGGALGLLYAALYGVLRSEQNALLLGSLLLFALLAALMLGTRRVDWYRIRPVGESEHDVRASARA
jgi:inner membrane protein